MTTDTTIDAAAARPVQRERAAAAPMPRNADGLPEPESDMSFWDVLDVVNPLQHIPVVNNIYRAVTGDEIGAPARVMGGILFGGVIGGAAAIANAVLEQSTGQDLGGHMLASLGFEETGGQATAVAQAPAQGQAPAAAAATTAAATTPAPAAPQTVAAATAAALRPTASAAPPESAARTPPAAGGVPLHDALASPVGEHRPSKMPARDTIPANTLQAKQAAALANQQRFAKPGEAQAAGARPTASATPPQAAAPAPAATPPAAAGPQAAEAATAPAGVPAGVPPDMLPDVMLRNLAKYEAARRAAAARTAPGLRVDG